MKHLEKEVIEELKHSLYEWGVNGSHDEHVSFRKKAFRDCVATLSSRPDEPIDHDALKREKFPKTYNDAYEHVLRNDTVPDQFQLCTSVGVIKDSFEPFHRYRDRRTGEIKYQLEEGLPRVFFHAT